MSVIYGEDVPSILYEGEAAQTDFFFKNTKKIPTFFTNAFTFSFSLNVATLVLSVWGQLEGDLLHLHGQAHV